jgi:hypothetical protein
MFMHYDTFVDHYYIFDNFSDDGTQALLAAHSNVTVKRYDTGNKFDDTVHQQLKNCIWKHSRGKADYVIVIDADEFIYHKNIAVFLQQNKKYSIFRPAGYNMVSRSFPDRDTSLTVTVKTGVRNDKYSKMALFDPYRIVNINYLPGAHEAYPEGIVTVGQSDELKLLHYKNLGTEYVLQRVAAYRHRLSVQNRSMNYGTEYDNTDQLISREIEQDLHNALQVIN